jgi:uncharacterized protein YdeI (YjbR/CyaY-like superfamily)
VISCAGAAEATRYVDQFLQGSDSGRMMAVLITIDVRTRQQWRVWLVKNHPSSPGIWLVRHKQHTGVKSMFYEDVVREALCFGSVDSLVKRLDDDRYAIKVTARKPASKWSDINRRRWNELKAAGVLAAAGYAAAPTENTYVQNRRSRVASVHCQSI